MKKLLKSMQSRLTPVPVVLGTNAAMKVLLADTNRLLGPLRPAKLTAPVDRRCRLRESMGPDCRESMTSADLSTREKTCIGR